MNRPLALALLLAAGCTSAPAGSGHGTLVFPSDRHDFGLAGVGEGAAQALRLEARGGRVTVLGADVVEGPFTAELEAPLVVEAGDLPPGEPHPTIGLVFLPERAGTFTGLLRLRTSEGVVTHPLAGEGVAAELDCDPATLDFGEVPAAVVTDRTVRCVNRSPVTWLFVADPPAGDDPRGFSVVDPRLQHGATPGGTYHFEVRFTGRLGRAEAVLPIRSRGGAFVFEVPLVATGVDGVLAPVPAGAAACPDGLDLGWVPPGGSRSIALPVRNLLDRAVTVGAVEILGAGFSVEPAAPFELPPDDPDTAEDESRIELAVTFAPGTTGPASAAITLRPVDPALAPLALCVHGFGGGPVIACSPERIDLGPVARGFPRSATVRCENRGVDVPGTDDDDLVLAPSVNGAGFAVSPAAATTIAAGAALDLVVRFDPEATGPAAGTLAIESNDPATPRLEVALAADGVVAGPCRLEAADLDFGDVLVGDGATLPVFVRNVGTDPCLLRDVRLEPEPSSFLLPDGRVDVTVLAPGERLRIPVRFPALESLPATGAIAFDVNDPAAPHRTVGLRARGVDVPGCLHVLPRTIDFGTVAPGCTSLRAEVRVWNLCGAAAPFGKVEVVGDAGLRLVAQPPDRLVPANGAVPVTFTVEVAPDADGPIDAGLRLTGDDGPVSPLLPVRARAGTPEGRDVFAPRNLIDVLWVSDNSDMTPYQHAVATHAATYLAPAFARPALDFHLGVTTTGTSNGGSCPGGANGQEDGRLFPVDGSRPRIVDRSMPDAAAVFGANVFTGMCHFEEMALLPAMRAVTPPLSRQADDPRYPQPSDGNLGFVRPGSTVAITVMMDEFDQSPDLPIHYLDRIRWWFGGVFREDRVVFHAITGPAVTGCSGNGSSAQANDRVVELIERTGGHFMSLCSADWEAGLARLGAATFGRTRFPLSARPADLNGDGVISFGGGDVQVLVGGRPWQMTASTAWTWNEAANALDFPIDWLPDADLPVELRYTPACR